MFKLLKLVDGRFGIEEKDQIAVGTRAEATDYAMDVFGVEKEQIDAAVADMEDKATNSAEFGMWRTFMFSTARDLSHVVKVDRAA